ncbi:ATP-binding protein [Kaarinaea lacus]
MTENNFSQLVEGLSKRQDTEHQQAFVRVLFSIVFATFVGVVHYTGWLGGVSGSAFLVVSLYCVGACALFGSILIWPDVSLRRRFAGIYLDILAITALLITGGENVALVYGGYLWVTIANGLRFGIQYLKNAHVSSLMGFAAVLVFSNYWHEHKVLGIGLWLWLFLLPIYVSKLLHILEGAVLKAENANKAKSTFLANMSHEIRTPLTAIIGYADVSLDSSQTMQERTTALKTIVRSGNHLLNIINDILDFSKVEADQLDVEFVSEDPFQIVFDVESLMKPHAEKKGLEFNVLYDFPLPTRFSTDPVRLKQILLNLCSNAIKFTDQGSVSITISCDCHNQVMQFTVKDTGIGMTEEQLKKLFKPFQQADSTITRRFGGTGLGLSLSKRLAEKLGGTIDVRSEPGKGSQFIFTTSTGMLQNVQFAHSLKQIPSTTEFKITTKNIVPLSGHILLAEDNETNQQLLSLFLRKMGAEVSVADNGEAAVKLAQQNHFDLIYMDMQMPVLSGVDAVKMLRKQGYDQPIVALTANATNEDKMKCIAAGCNDFLTKPVPREKLYNMTSKYLPTAELSDVKSEPIVSTLLSEEPTFRDLVEKFVSELPVILEKIQRNYDQEDWDTLQDELHSLKGMGGGFGYYVLTELAGKAEFQVSSENYQAAKTLLDEIHQISDRIYEGILLDGENVIELKTNSTG